MKNRVKECKSNMKNLTEKDFLKKQKSIIKTDYVNLAIFMYGSINIICFNYASLFI